MINMATIAQKNDLFNDFLITSKSGSSLKTLISLYFFKRNVLLPLWNRL